MVVKTTNYVICMELLILANNMIDIFHNITILRFIFNKVIATGPININISYRHYQHLIFIKIKSQCNLTSFGHQKLPEVENPFYYTGIQSRQSVIRYANPYLSGAITIWSSLPNPWVVSNIQIIYKTHPPFKGQINNNPFDQPFGLA